VSRYGFGLQCAFARFQRLPGLKAAKDQQAFPFTAPPEPRSLTPQQPPRAHPAQAAAVAEMGSGSGGESCHARWAARRTRLGLREMPQNRVHDIVVDDEGNDAHLPTAIWAHQRVHLIDALDELCPTSAESAGAGAAIPAGSRRPTCGSPSKPSRNTGQWASQTA